MDKEVVQEALTTLTDTIPQELVELYKTVSSLQKIELIPEKQNEYSELLNSLANDIRAVEDVIYNLRPVLDNKQYRYLCYEAERRLSVAWRDACKFGNIIGILGYTWQDLSSAYYESIESILYQIIESDKSLQTEFAKSGLVYTSKLVTETPDQLDQ